jgi:hypothetical protein
MDHASSARPHDHPLPDRTASREGPAVLDHIRPTVVVRRHAAALAAAPRPRPPVVETPAPPPPIRVAPPPEAPPAPRRIAIGATIAVAQLADATGRRPGEVAAELVARGFFEVNARTVLPRETARIVAEAFGFGVEEVPNPVRRAAPGLSRISARSGPGARPGARSDGRRRGAAQVARVD